ncbi:hypothetical protein ACH4TP_37945 [Streptomyces sp. NPDC021012]
MNRAELLAGLSELIANPFIPELHEDDCDDHACPGCALPDINPSTADGVA